MSSLQSWFRSDVTLEPRTAKTEQDAEVEKEEERGKSTSLSPTTKNRLASLFNRIPKFGKDRKGGEQEVSGSRRDKVTANLDSSPSNSATIR